MNYKNILLFGVPRSGTTWLAKILMAGGELNSIHEPDNERHTYSAYYYKRGLPRFPFIRSTDNNNNYLALFQRAFEKGYIASGSNSNEILFRLGGVTKEKVEAGLNDPGYNKVKKAYPEMLLYPMLPKQVKKGKRRLLKSVHATLAADFLLNHFDIDPVFIIRHPASVVSSHLYLKNEDIDRRIYLNRDFMNSVFNGDIPDISSLTTEESRGGFQLALFYRVVNSLVNKYPNIQLIQYEDLAANPEAVCKNIFKKINLNWNTAVSQLIAESNKSGEGYETNRVASEQIDIWKKRLTDRQIQEIKKGYALVAPIYYKEFAKK